MRRFVTLVPVVVAVLAGLVGVAACSGSSGPAPRPTANRSGNPTDTASPLDTVGPTPSEPDYAIEGPTPVAAGTAAGQAATAGLAACLTGNWSAPVSREFDHLGLGSRSRGAVRSGTGLLRLTLARDKTYTFTYDDVILQMPAGQAKVIGPVSGTWSLAGSTLHTVLIKSATKVSVGLGGVSVGAPGVLADAVATLPPPEVFVTCGQDRLEMQLSDADGGGTVQFDRA